MKAMKTSTLVLAGLLVALVLAGVVSFYASGAPDGLTRVSEDHGFASSETGHGTAGSPMAGYSTKGVDNERLSGGVAGITGTLVVLVLAGGGFWLLRRRDSAVPQEA